MKYARPLTRAFTRSLKQLRAAPMLLPAVAVCFCVALWFGWIAGGLLGVALKRDPTPTQALCEAGHQVRDMAGRDACVRYAP